MEINHILVPIDFSESSKNALQAAVKIAKKSGAKITLVNAVHVHTPLPHLKGGNLIEAVVSDYEHQVQEAFHELETEMVELKDVPHELDRFVAYLTDAIYSETESRDIDLIVMGTRAEHTLGERILGSNAIEIIRNSEVPVLVIPERFHGFNPQRIGFASDFLRAQDRGQLTILNAIAQLFESEIMVFHIGADINEEEQKQIDLIKDDLKGIKKLSIRVVSADSVISGIKKFSKTHELNLLVLMPRRHNLFERLFITSVTKEVAIDMDIPLLTFHE
jgi:nucleotide-binding universal stress UspA family protein